MAIISSITRWRPTVPFYYGWLVMVMLTLAAFASSGITQVVLGGIQGLIHDDTGWTLSTIALAISIGTWTSGLISPVLGRIVDRYGARLLMPLATITIAISFFSFAEGHKVWHFYAAYIFGRGLGNPILTGVVPRTVAVNYFRRKRNFALSLVSLNRPVGAAINIQLISMITRLSSWRMAYRYMGFFSLAMVIPLVIIMRRRPEDIGLLPDGDKTSDSASTHSIAGVQGSTNSDSNAETNLSEDHWTLKEARTTKAFWCIGTTMVLALLGGSTIGFTMVPYIKESAHVSLAQSAGVLTLSTLLAIAVFLWGHLASRFTPRRVLIVALMASSLTVYFLLNVDSLISAYLFGICWGIVSGSIGALEEMLIAQYFGRYSFGTITGSLAPFTMAALGLGPFLGAGVREAFGSYDELYILLSIIYVVGAALIYFAKQPPPPVRASISYTNKA